MQAAASLVGTIVNEKYQLLALAGAGGMGTVFKAKQLDLDRIVAVKMLDPQKVTDIESLKRFEREAKSISSLSNAHIANFYTYGVFENALPYIVMEWLDGISLNNLIKNESRITSDRAIHIALQIADALAAAHRAGIIHRDLKPANIMLISQPEADFVKLVDFGLASLEISGEPPEQKLTRTGFLLGTPHYLSPEQCQGQKADARSDIYALGCVLYEMLCLQPPFEADDAIAVIHKHMNDTVIPPSKKSKVLLPDGLEPIVLKCLSKWPQERYQTMEEVHDALLQVRDRRAVAHTAPPRLSAQAKDLRRKVILARFAAAIVLFGAVAIFGLVKWMQSDTGSVAGAEFTLKNEPSKTKMLECMDTAERLWRQGKSEPALRIELAADHALKLDARKPAEAVKAYVSFASELQKRGDNNGAFDFAFKALKLVQNQAATRIGEKPGGGVAELAAVIDDGCGIMLRSKKPLSKEQLETVLDIALKHSGELIGLDKGRIYDLCIDASKSSSGAPTTEILECMMAKNNVLASRGSLTDLDKSMEKSYKALAKVQSPSTLRPAPEPCQLSNLSEIAQIVAYRDTGAALKYALDANELYKQLDVQHENEKNSVPLAAFCLKMAQTFKQLKEFNKALPYARQAVSFNPTQDIVKAKSINLLNEILIRKGKYSEALPLATSNYEYFKSLDHSTASIAGDRTIAALQLGEILYNQKKESSATKILNAELKDALKSMPESAYFVAKLYSGLLAGTHNKATINDDLKGMCDARNRIQSSTLKFTIDGELMDHAARLNQTKILVEAEADAVSILRSEKTNTLMTSYVETLCAYLPILKKEANPDIYAQTLELIQDRFQKLLEAGSSEPTFFARVINDLGSSGEEKIADGLRSQATEKLPEDRAAIFLSRCMDFVAGEGSNGATFADPQHALKVYMDLAHNMQSKKNNEDSFKYAFEALKIVRVLAVRKPEMRAMLLDSANDAAAVMLQSKQAVSKEQWRTIYDVCSLEMDNVKKEGKDQILELTLQSRVKSDEPVSAELMDCMFTREGILASHDLTAALDTQVNKTVSALAQTPGTSIALMDHLLDLAGTLIQKHNPASGRRYLMLSKKILEDISARQVAALDTSKQNADAGKKSAAGNAGKRSSSADTGKKATTDTGKSATTDTGKNSPASVGKQVASGARGKQIVAGIAANTKNAPTLDAAKSVGVDASKQTPFLDMGKLAMYWSRFANLFAQVGDKQTALICAKKAVALRPFETTAAGECQLVLADRFIDLGNYAEAEPVVLAAYKFAKTHTQSPDVLGLRIGATKRLFDIMVHLHQDAQAVATVKEEIGLYKNPSPGQASQIMELYKQLANYYQDHGDPKDVADCLTQITQLKPLLSPEQRGLWARRGIEGEILQMAVKLNDSKLASESVMELLNSTEIDKAESIKLSKWWVVALNNFRKTGETHSYQDVMNFVQQGFRQLLGRAVPDQALLADVINEFDSLGEAKIAGHLRAEALRKLPAAAHESFLAKCKTKSVPETSNDKSGTGESTGKENGAGTTGSDTSTKPDEAKPSEAKPGEGRIDEGKPDETPAPTGTGSNSGTQNQ